MLVVPDKPVVKVVVVIVDSAEVVQVVVRVVEAKEVAEVKALVVASDQTRVGLHDLVTQATSSVIQSAATR